MYMVKCNLVKPCAYLKKKKLNELNHVTYILYTSLTLMQNLKITLTESRNSC